MYVLVNDAGEVYKEQLPIKRCPSCGNTHGYKIRIFATKGDADLVKQNRPGEGWGVSLLEDVIVLDDILASSAK